MATESEHVLKVDVKQTKKRKSYNIDKPRKKDVIKGINDESIYVFDFQLDVAEAKVNLKKKKCKDKKEMDEIILPQGLPMQLIARIEFSSNDIGSTLQFLEFCSAYEQVCTSYPKCVLSLYLWFKLKILHCGYFLLHCCSYTFNITIFLLQTH